MLTLLLIGLVVMPQAKADTALTPQEWDWYAAAKAKADAGDLAGAAAIWRQMVDSLKRHNPDACGNYAQQLGRALDSLGRYDEAVQAFEDEFACWGQFPDRSEWMLWDRRRAEQIRPEIRTFVSRSTEGENPGPLAKFEPPFGAIVGGTIDLDDAIWNDVSRTPDVYGKGYGMVLVYARWGERIPIISTASAKKAGAALQVGWEPTGGLDQVKDDTYVREFARSLKAYGLPVFLRYASEMNGAWTDWYSDPAKYKEKFALIARIMREEAPNVAMVWSPNFIGDQPWADYYPGDEYVDWVGINLYHEAYFAGKPDSRQMLNDIYYAGRSNPMDKFKEIYAAFAKRKPIMVSETGVAWATRDPYHEDVDWAVETLRQVYEYLPLLYPRIKAICYFQVDFMAHPRVPSSGHYVISGNARMTAAYREVLANSWYLDSPKASAPQFWRPIEQATLSGPTRVATYAHLGAGVDRVEYALDGQVVATANRLPWVADLDLDGLAGVHQLTVRAYDKAGRLGAEKTYSFDASAVRISLGGKVLDLPQPPILLDGVTMVPARAIFEALGAKVTWDASASAVIAEKGADFVRITVESPVALKNGLTPLALARPAILMGGRVLVPIRFAAEAFDMAVSWDPATRTVQIGPKS